MALRRAALHRMPAWSGVVGEDEGGGWRPLGYFRGAWLWQGRMSCKYNEPGTPYTLCVALPRTTSPLWPRLRRCSPPRRWSL